MNVKLSNSQLHKLKSGVKTGTEVNLNLSSNMVDDSNDEINFPNKLLLTNRQVLKFCRIFTNNLSVNTNLSKTYLHKI